MSKRGEKTDEPGIYRLDDGRFRVLTTATAPSGELKRRQTTLEHGQTMEEAIAERDRLKRQIRQPDNPTPTAPTLTSFSKRWMKRKARKVKPSTAKSYARIIGDRVLPVPVQTDQGRAPLGELELGDLQRRHVLQWVDWASNATPEGGEAFYATDTVRKWWRHFRPLLKDLAAAGHTDRDLSLRVDPPTTPRRGVRQTEAVDFDTLRSVVQTAERVAPDRHAEIATLVYTGMRAGELWALKWEDLDHSAGTITVRRSVSDGEVTESTKTGEARTVPMIGPVSDALEAHRERLVREQHPGLETGLVFPSTQGTVRLGGSLRHAFRNIEEALDLEVRLRPQLIRKSVVTRLRSEGVPQMAARALVGHSDESIQEHYFSANDETRQLLGALVEGGGTG